MNVKRKTLNKPNDLRPLTVGEVCALENCSPPLLTIGNRIVWLSDNGPEFGYIKWLGKLPDVGNDWMAGVHFDNPVGSGTGIYNDYQLFEAPHYHASLVPVIGLLRAEDFLGTSVESQIKPSQSSQPSQTSSSSPGLIVADIPLKPRRSKRRSGERVDDNKSNDVISSAKYNENSCECTNGVGGDAGEDIRDSIALPPKGSSSSKPSNDYHNQEKSSSTTSSSSTGSSAFKSPNSASHNSHLVTRDMHLNHINSKELSKPSRETNLQPDCNKLALNGKYDEDEMDIGSLVEVTIDDIPRYGVIKWIGNITGQAEENHLIAGIELEDEYACGTDGSWNGKRYFDCAPKRGYFIRLSQCRKDSRFSSLSERKRSLVLVGSDSSRITCDIPPLSSLDDLKYLCGKARGIQGHHNSCYLDATLFAMFSCTTIFESLLHRPQSSTDIAEYSEVQKILKEEIVNPLRANLYVSADRVMHLRTLLEKLTSVRGLTSEEKDPEEFLNLLLNQILKAEPYLKLSSGLESYFYQLFVDKDEKLVLPTVQQLFDQSFLASDFKLREIPPCLLIQMPRFGRQFKMYPRIIPSLYLDITDVLENSPRQCSICGQLAEYECKECFGQFGEGLESTAFCQKCLDKIHAHKKRTKHKTTKLSIPSEFTMLKEHTQVQRIYMELFAVLCIETSHYVAFVKCGNGPDAPWCFFDSMADRNGEQDGYNIPEVVPFPNLRWWLSDEGTALLLTTKDDKLLPEMARRLLCDAYMCMYQSPDLTMYR